MNMVKRLSAGWRREALEEIFSDKSRPRAILSLGGGTVTSEQCRQLIRQHTDCFYLRATTDTLLDNLEGHSDGRPMLNPTQPVEAQSTETSSETRSPPPPHRIPDANPLPAVPRHRQPHNRH